MNFVCESGKRAIRLKTSGACTRRRCGPPERCQHLLPNWRIARRLRAHDSSEPGNLSVISEKRQQPNPQYTANSRGRSEPNQEVACNEAVRELTPKICPNDKLWDLLIKAAFQKSQKPTEDRKDLSPIKRWDLADDSLTESPLSLASSQH